MEYQVATKEGILTVKEYKKGLEIVSYAGEDIYLEIPEICLLRRNSAADASLERTAGSVADVSMKRMAGSVATDASVERTAAGAVTDVSGKTVADSVGDGDLEMGIGIAKPVISIGKKALLSCKKLRRVSLPGTVEEVGDWAFAYCDELREVRLPERGISFGRGIFRECGKLRFVAVEGKEKDVHGLLAAAVTLLDAPYLFTPMRCGDPEWLRQWDARMLQIMRAADRDGYSKMVLCGEEDYGSKENNLEYFLNQKRKGKVRIAFMRLLHPLGLQDEVRAELERYLREHTAGCACAERDRAGSGRERSGGYASENSAVSVGTAVAGHGQKAYEHAGKAPGLKDAEEVFDETWQVLLSEHGEESEYYKLFTEIGCLRSDNFDRILSEAGEDHPEMKAWFLKYKEETIGYTDFFADLML